MPLALPRSFAALGLAILILCLCVRVGLSHSVCLWTPMSVPVLLCLNALGSFTLPVPVAASAFISVRRTQSLGDFLLPSRSADSLVSSAILWSIKDRGEVGRTAPAWAVCVGP